MKIRPEALSHLAAKGLCIAEGDAEIVRFVRCWQNAERLREMANAYYHTQGEELARQRYEEAMAEVHAELNRLREAVAARA